MKVTDDIYNNVDQIKRFEKASGNSLKMLSFDSGNCIAEFEGSSGEIYHTTLDDCDCMDCSMRRLPCKHMYRLAIEYGSINPNAEPWKLYKNYSKIFNRIKKKVATLDLEELNVLENYIDEIIAKQ